MSDNDINRFNVLLEDLTSKMDVVVEAVTDTQEKVGRVEGRVAHIEERLDALERDMEVVMYSIKSDSRRLTEVEQTTAELHRRVTRLEAA